MVTRRHLIGMIPAASLLTAANGGRSDYPVSDTASASVLSPGVHRIERDTVIDHDLLLMPGATFDIASGRTLTLRGDMIAPRSRVFGGPGQVDLNDSRVPIAYPEWWGARADDEATDSLTALQACVAAHPVTQLGQGRYFIGGTWKIARSNRRVWGVSATPLGNPRGTHIVLRSGSGDVLQIGPDRFPGGIYDCPQGIDVRYLQLTRTEPVEPPAHGSEGKAPAGVRFQFVLRGHLEDLGSVENSIGFYVGGVARSFIRRCEAFRTRPGRRSDNDIFWGFFFDGDARIGFAGGNASIYASDCFVKVEKGPPLTRDIGAYLRGGFADTFLLNFEMADMGQGILVEGSARDPDRNLQRTGNADLHIHMPVLDQCRRSCLELGYLSDYAAVDIVDGYFAPTAEALVAIHIHDSRGQSSVTGGQLLGPGMGPGRTVGVHVVDAEGFAIRGAKIRGFVRPVGVTRGRDFEIEASISNPEQKAVQGALQFRDCDRGMVRSRVKGQPAAFPQGVYLDGVNRHMSIDVTGIDPASIEGGAVNKLREGSAAIRAPGPFGTNYATGVLE